MKIYSWVIKVHQLMFVVLSMSVMVFSAAWGGCAPYVDSCWLPAEGCPLSNQQLQQQVSCCTISNIESDGLNRWQKWRVRYEVRDSSNSISYECEKIDKLEGFNLFQVSREVKCVQVELNNNNNGRKISGVGSLTFTHNDGETHTNYCGYWWGYLNIDVQ
jgi:hypothetical protein